MGKILRVGIRIKTNKFGEEMIYPWFGPVSEGQDDTFMSRSRRWARHMLLGNEDDQVHLSAEGQGLLSRHRRRVATANGTKVYFEMDNRNCERYGDGDTDKCFSQADQVAQFLGAALLNKDWDPPVAVKMVGSNRGAGPDVDTKGDSSPFMTLIVACVGVLVLTIVVIMVLTSRKRVRGITWFPDGFFSKAAETGKPAHSRNMPEGEEMQ